MTCVNVGCDGLGRVTTRPGARTCGLVGKCTVDRCEVGDWWAGFEQVKRDQVVFSSLVVAERSRRRGRQQWRG